MSLAGALLVLLAAACHATWNFLIKRLNAGAELVWLFAALSMVIYAPAAVWVAWDGFTLGPKEAFFYVGTAFLHLGYFLLLQTGYRHGDLSLVYPTARATGPFLSTLFAVAVLGERLTPQIALGAGLIIVGVLMLTGGLRRGRGRRAAVSLAFGLTVGIFIGSYTVFDAYAVSVVLIPPLLLDYASQIGRTVFLAPVAARRWDRVLHLWRNHRVEVLLIAALNSLAYILVLYAFTFTPVVMVAPLRELSVLIAVVLGSVFLGEGALRHRFGWALVILAGTVTLVTAR